MTAAAGAHTVKEVRRLLETTSLPLLHIAAKVGLSVATVTRMTHKKTYQGYGWSEEAQFSVRGVLIRHVKSPLTPEQVKDIVMAYAKAKGQTRGIYGLIKRLAAQYHVSTNTIRRVIRGDSWSAETGYERRLLEHME